MIWSKQSSYLRCAAVAEGGDPGAAPAAGRSGRTAATHEWKIHLIQRRHHLDAGQVGVPVYAAWDLAFHTIALAVVDPPIFAKRQLLLLTRRMVHAPERPAAAYEWAFRRRQPAGARLADLRVFRWDRKRRRLTNKDDPPPAISPFSSGLPQTDVELHLVVNRKDAEGRKSFRAASRPWTTSGVPIAARPARRRLHQRSRTARDGWRCTAST